MKTKADRLASCLLIWLFLTVVSLSGVAAEEPMLRSGERITANGLPLDVGDQAIPCVCDWNNDSRKDLIVGYRNADKIALFLNQGTDANPAFGTFENLQAAGVDIVHPGSACGAPAPWVCDYDNDGKKDLLVGTGDNGYVYFYENSNTDADPVLTSGARLTVGGSTLSVGARATPYVHDWDEDGLNDLLCGDANGNVHLFRNVGTAGSPSYASDTLIQVSGVPADFGFRSAIRVLDWDGDGLKDLLGSAGNNASWCRNVGTNAAPVLEMPVRLQAPEEGIGLANIDTGYRMRLEVVDWNEDGVTDLLIGTHDGYVMFYEGYDFAIASIEAQSESEIAIQWNSAAYLTYNVLAGETPASLSPIAAGLTSAGKTTSWGEVPAGQTRFYKVEVSE